VNGMPFTSEDFDLLKSIGDQVGANLLNMQLSRRLVQAKELEAFQTMSAFFVHDLKNTASSLSLLLQNLPTHFHDPAFRADALRAVGKGVERINELITRLGLLRQSMKIEARLADLNEAVEQALAGLGQLERGVLVKQLQPIPRFPFDSHQVQKVVINLALNAIEALNGGGEVRVETSCRDGWACVTVADTGCGMTREFMDRSLYRPFQTTKKKGIGIGMFHTKTIVEAHRGRIEVESQSGHGTTFRVLLPMEGIDCETKVANR
jgi:putative PEP-CTERM system histidine kinase